MNVTGVSYFKLEVNYDSLKNFLDSLVTKINENKTNIDLNSKEI